MLPSKSARKGRVLRNLVVEATHDWITKCSAKGKLIPISKTLTCEECVYPINSLNLNDMRMQGCCQISNNSPFSEKVTTKTKKTLFSLACNDIFYSLIIQFHIACCYDFL